jgi:uncharacterized protein YqgQ
MLTLINILILFFVILIIIQLILANHNTEGLENNNEYKSYDMNDPNNALILGQQNAGNINYLKKRMDDIQNMRQEVDDLGKNYQNLQKQVDDLVLAQQEYTTKMIGDEPPEITGAVSDEPVDVTTFVA